LIDAQATWIERRDVRALRRALLAIAIRLDE
jgi:hypothetical protein